MRRNLILLLCIIASQVLTAQSAARIVSVHFLPPEYYVGDTVELRVVLDSSPDTMLQTPGALPAVDWLLFRGARVEKAGEYQELRIFFSSFAPGTRTLPELRFGDYTLAGMKIHTTSILEDREGELADLRGQLNFPGTLPLLFITVLLVFIGPLSVMAASGIVRQRLRSAARYLSRRQPYWRFKRDLKELNAQILNMRDRDFYYRLSDAVRSYISRRTGGDCISTTIFEIRTMMRSIFPAGDAAMRLIHFLEYADTIKFAGIEAGDTKKGDDLLRLSELVASMESQYRKRESEEKDRVDL